MKTDIIETGDLSSQITITIDPADYKNEFDKELKKYRKKAHLKGFRKGKTPLSAIRKMYGKGVLVEVINDKLQKAIDDCITENDLDILGNPIPAEDQGSIDFETKTLETLEFKFDLGLAPKIDVKGVDNGDTYIKYTVVFEEDRVDEEIEELRRRNGKQEDVQESIEENDIVTMKITAIPSHEQGEEEEPWSEKIMIMPERLVDEMKTVIIGKNVGDQLTIDIYNLEKDTDEESVQRYFLKDAPEGVGKDFNAEIITIKRLIPAEVNEEFFEKMFDPYDKITDLDGAKEKIKKDLQDFYEQQGKVITQRKILEALIEKNKTEFPDAFLKRWLMSTNEELTEEQLEEEYEGFIKNLTWTLMKQDLREKFEIEITHEDIKEGVVADIKKRFSQFGYGIMASIDFERWAERTMEEPEAVQKKYEELLADAVLDRVTEEVSLTDEVLDIEAYKEMVEQMQQ